MRIRGFFTATLMIFFSIFSLLLFGCRDVGQSQSDRATVIEYVPEQSALGDHSKGKNIISRGILNPRDSSIDIPVSSNSQNNPRIDGRRRIINSVYADQARILAAPTGRLTIAIDGLVDYKPISQGKTKEQILNHIYSEDYSLRQEFFGKNVEFETTSNGVVVIVYANDYQTILVRDNSETEIIDEVYGRN